ncbi:phage portal protein family protein [Ectopseudomonas oleovorans]|uniref:phage portal protein family protein n=1 Tax=Ectopseudomonas oleovorans TaxID=301 RepID=UPI003F1DBDB6
MAGNWLGSRINKGDLGQTMTTDRQVRAGQANVHNEVRMDILRADAKQLAATLNRDLVRTFIDLNFGPQERYPRIVLQVTEAEDLKAGPVVRPFIDQGLPVQAGILDKFGLAAPKPRSDPAPAELHAAAGPEPRAQALRLPGLRGTQA